MEIKMKFCKFNDESGKSIYVNGDLIRMIRQYDGQYTHIVFADEQRLMLKMNAEEVVRAIEQR